MKHVDLQNNIGLSLTGKIDNSLDLFRRTIKV